MSGKRIMLRSQFVESVELITATTTTRAAAAAQRNKGIARLLRWRAGERKINRFKSKLHRGAFRTTEHEYKLKDFNLNSIFLSSSSSSFSFTLCVYVNKFKPHTHTVPPRITPFNFGDDIQEGMRVQTMCTSTQGDQPFNITWYRDAKPLRVGEQIDPVSSSSSNQHHRHHFDERTIEINTLQSFSSILTIHNITSALSGNYSCLISNPAGAVEYTAALSVSGKYREHALETCNRTTFLRTNVDFTPFNCTLLQQHQQLSCHTYLFSSEWKEGERERKLPCLLPRNLISCSAEHLTVSVREHGALFRRLNLKTKKS
jgi:hypothetical protein